MEPSAGAKNGVNLHLDILPSQTKTALDFLSKQPWLKESGWYLAGGTALSLHAGHRKSFDLDFFTQQKGFGNNQLLSHFLAVKEWETNINKENTVYGNLFSAKISFITNPLFIPKQNFTQYRSVNIIGPLDVAVMKVITVSQRGRKRDFYDLFWCAKNLEPLEGIVQKLPSQYPNIAHNYHHVLTSLVYFDDAESDPEPEIYFDAKWEEVKGYFNREVPRIAQKVMELN